MTLQQSPYRINSINLDYHYTYGSALALALIIHSSDKRPPAATFDIRLRTQSFNAATAL
jgi:hypothetical protein